jgi:hypothetical protein
VEELLPRLRHLVALNGSGHHLALLKHSGGLCELTHLKVALTCLSELVQVLEHFCCSKLVVSCVETGSCVSEHFTDGKKLTCFSKKLFGLVSQIFGFSLVSSFLSFGHETKVSNFPS